MGYSTFFLERSSHMQRKVNSVIQEINNRHMSPIRKTHLKAAKELSMSTNFTHNNIPDDSAMIARRLLHANQYDREKHLENVQNNSHHECFSKLPIL